MFQELLVRKNELVVPFIISLCNVNLFYDDRLIILIK